MNELILSLGDARINTSVVFSQHEYLVYYFNPSTQGLYSRHKNKADAIKMARHIQARNMEAFQEKGDLE